MIAQTVLLHVQPDYICNRDLSAVFRAWVKLRESVLWADVHASETLVTLECMLDVAFTCPAVLKFTESECLIDRFENADSYKMLQVNVDLLFTMHVMTLQLQMLR